jgi:archaellum component FlaF (FlaF/FlaG flagellin family)
MRTTNIMPIKDRRGVSTIMGTLIFVGILFTSVIPMMLVMNQADTIYVKKVKEVEVKDDERVEEDLVVYIYPGGDTEIKVRVKNQGTVSVTIVRVWINNEYNSTSELIPTGTQKDFGPFNVTDLEEGDTVEVKVVTERGNVFYSISGNLYFYEGGWSTTSVGICVIIHNPKGGEYQVYLLNGTIWSDKIYESKDKEWEDVIASTPVSVYPNLDYMVDVKKRKGVNWKSLPGSPIPTPIEYPVNGPPFIMVWIDG